LIDIHFHCLPGIDDGPRNWDEAVALCRAAEADGADAIIATPHVLRDPWLNELQGSRDELILELNTRLGGHPAILPGCEYFFSSDAVDLWKLGAGGPLTGLNRSPFLLVEFPSTTIPMTAEAVFHELSVLGVTPVIAHPERNLVFVEQPERLARFVELGAMTQVTAGGLLGDFGKRAQSACDDFFKRGLVQFVASDAHSIERRPPRLAAANDAVTSRWGREAANALFASDFINQCVEFSGS
jgi:protein-tyrosine phosphatase